MPSRVGSKASSRPSRNSTRRRPPSIPRKSSRRKSASMSRKGGNSKAVDPNRLSTIRPSPPSSPEAPHNRLYDPDLPREHYLRPSTAGSNRLPFGSEPSSASGNRLSAGESTTSSMLPPVGEDTNDHSEARVGRSSSALRQFAPDVRGDRPTSMGYVQQHRTSVHLVTPDNRSHLGSTAEVVDDPNRRSASSERRLAEQSQSQ